MKTKIEYQIERFKQRYHYDNDNKTIIFLDCDKNQLEIPIDIGIGEYMTEFFDMGDSELFSHKTYRETRTDTGILNIPIIHLSKYFFESKPFVQDCSLYHEIGHLLLQSLNTFTLDTKFLSPRTVHSDVYAYYIDKIKNDLTESIYLHVLENIKEICSEYENNKTNIMRRDIYFRLVEICETYEKELDLSAYKDIVLANEIEAELFSFVHHPSYFQKMERYMNVDYPNYIYKYNRNHDDSLLKSPIDVAKTTRRILNDVVSNQKISENLWIYRLA